jgi:methylglutaconyl-CoA hydratase
MENIIITRHARKGFITLNRLDKRNALDFDMISELKEGFQQHLSDPEVKVIILRSNGPTFCSGADLGYLQRMQSFTKEQNLEDSRHLAGLYQMIFTAGKIVIAQVQGHALAGGCGLASVCDFIFAANNAKFGYTEVRLGFIPAIVMVFLLRKIGGSNARRMLLTSEMLLAAEAVDIGLITKAVDSAMLESEVLSFAENLIRTNSGEAMGMTKQMISNVQGLSLDAGIDYAVHMNAIARSTADFKRGVAAFLNKESITW